MRSKICLSCRTVKFTCLLDSRFPTATCLSKPWPLWEIAGDVVSEGSASLNLASDCDAVDERLAEIFHQPGRSWSYPVRKTVSNARMLHGGAIKISHRSKVSLVCWSGLKPSWWLPRRRCARATSWDSEYHEEAGTAEPMGGCSPAREISKSDKKLL
jgi:hypothetical protein